MNTQETRKIRFKKFRCCCFIKLTIVKVMQFSQQEQINTSYLSRECLFSNISSFFSFIY